MKKKYIESIKSQFQYYKMMGEKTFEQLTEKELFWQFNESSNSIAIIVNHLQGNMLSRWTDFLTTDGEKDFRNRDQEFEDIIDSREEFLIKWEAGWACLFQAIDSIHEDNFQTEIFIRNMGHSIIEAFNRQLAHYAFHIGQIIFVGKMIKGNDWKSLSIPKGESKKFNQEKFSKPKRTEHFTTQFLKNNNK